MENQQNKTFVIIIFRNSIYFYVQIKIIDNGKKEKQENIYLKQNKKGFLFYLFFFSHTT